MAGRKLWVALSLVFVVVVFVPFLAMGKVCIGGDMIDHGIPIASFVHRMGREGKVYLWNPYVSCGIPTILSSIGTSFNVFYVFFLLFDPVRSMLYFFILHQTIAFLCACFYLTSHRFSALSSIVGALFYTFSAVRIYHSINIEYYTLLTLAPLVLLLVDKVVSVPNIKSTVLLGGVVGLVLLGGGIPFWIIYFPIFVAYGIFKSFMKGKESIKRFAFLVLSVVLGIGISFISLMPLFYHYGKGEFARSVPLTFNMVTLHSVNWKSLLIIPFANFFGSVERAYPYFSGEPWEYSYSLGVAGIFFVALSFLMPRKRTKHSLWFFSTLVLLGFFLSFGKNNPLYRVLFENIYIFSHFRVPARYLVFFPLFSLYAVSCGVENLNTILHAKRHGRNVNLSLMHKFWILFSVVYGVLYVKYGNGSALNTACLFSSLLLLEGVILLLSLRHKAWKKQAWMVYGFVGVSIFLTLIDPLLFFHPFKDNKEMLTEINFLKTLKGKITSPYERIFYTIHPNTPSMVGIRNIAGMTPLNLRDYYMYMYATLNRRLPSMDVYRIHVYHNLHPILWLPKDKGLLGTPNTTELLKINWDKIYLKKFKNNKMYKLLCPVFTVFPKKFFVEHAPYRCVFVYSHCEVVPSKEEVLKKMARREFDPTKVLMLSEPTPFKDIPCHIDPKNPPYIVFFSPHKIVIDLRRNYGWILISERFSSLWKAKVDGKTRQIYRGNFFFRAIPVFAKERKIIMYYDPYPVKIGALVSGLTVMICFILLGHDLFCKVKQ